MKDYHFLVAGLAQINMEESKLPYTVQQFKEDVLPFVTEKDRKLLELPYLQYDNLNILDILAGNTNIDENRCPLYERTDIEDFIQSVERGAEARDFDYPMYMFSFLTEYFEHVSQNQHATPAELGVYARNELNRFYYDYACSVNNRFVREWYSFNMNVKNLLSACTVRKYALKADNAIIGDDAVARALRTSGSRDWGLSMELDYFDDVMRIDQEQDLTRKEKMIDTLKWNWLEENSFFNYFTVEALFVFISKLEIVNRWIKLDAELGNRMLRSIIADFKADVNVPQNFE
ncbi:MAG: DUF2764 domain-containing protein [Bacteroidaceae bacterium]|nr:DUF2764 domain-containing protein [Bacteroidaceae bacterium]